MTTPIPSDDDKQAQLRQAALDYHEFPRPGKLEIRATKPLANGRDLSRAYSPGVAEATSGRSANNASTAVLPNGRISRTA